MSIRLVRIGGALSSYLGISQQELPLAPLETLSPFIFSSDICARDMSWEERPQFPPRRSNC
jgi:hypothetical protein